MKRLLFFLLLIGILAYIDWVSFLNSPVTLEQGRFVVKAGESFYAIEDRVLANNQALFPDLLYKLYVKFFTNDLLPGVRVFQKQPTFTELMPILEKETGPVNVRLPEGEVGGVFAETLDRFGINSKDKLLSCFKSCVIDEYKDWRFVNVGYEGFLFPDTYSFALHTDPRQILGTLLANFSTRTQPLQKKYAVFLSSHGIKNIVTMASLLEREAVGLEDKRMVAGILYKRLGLGMRLDVDATVLYLKGDWKASLSAADLAIDSPYNTRKNVGLPPSPICNPSLESIEAALSPISSNYLYYLSDKRGEMHYAATLEGHVQNKWKFL